MIITMASGVIGTAVALNFFGEGTILIPGPVIYIAVAVIILVVLLGIGDTKEIKVKFTCLPWQAPTGGDNCEKCNEDPLKPCTEYRCDSLGQACELINENTDKPICQSLQREVNPPVITPGEIKTSGHMFQNSESKKVEIRKDNGECLQEFVPVEFTLDTDEFAQCKWDLERTANFESLTNFHGEGTHFSLNHSFTVGGLSLSLLEANNVSGDLIEGFIGDVNIFVRCQDYFGNFNLNEYVVNFCVNSGPDLTPVMHALTTISPGNGATLKFGANETNFTMWINEPAECKYDILPDKDYDEMESSFNCKTGLADRETFGWPCETTLTNLSTENDFYIKCQDQPWLENVEERNTNEEDFVYTIFVSESELEIDSINVLFNGNRNELNQETFTKISGGGTSFSIDLEVITSGGSNDGISSCSYEFNNNFIPFFNTNSNTHEQTFNLLDGDYNFSIKCEDGSENEVIKNAMFNLNIDDSSPKVVRVFSQSGRLNLITDEQAKCYVSLDDVRQCSFDIEDVEAMNSIFSTAHSTSFDPGKTHYIKCQDLFGNQNPSCAIKVSPTLF